MSALASPGRRVAAATGVIVLLTAVALGVTLWREDSAGSQYRKAIRITELTLPIAADLHTNLSDRAALVARYVAFPTPSTRGRLLAARMAFNREASALRSSGALDATGQTQLDGLVAASEQRGNEALSTVLPAAGTSRSRSALAQYTALTAVVSDRVNALMTTLRGRAAQLRASADHDSSQARLLALSVGLLAVIVSFLLALYSSRLIRRLLERIRETGQGLAIAASEMRAAAVQAAASTSEQSAAIAEVTAAAEELSVTAVSLAENARTGVDAAEQTGHTMAEMQEQVQVISDRSLTLGERTQKISDVLGLINEIAERTNLLALNAAIEAARAGDSGRGFAVVASEIRKLAERSVQATDTIREIISTVQNETNATIMATEQGAKRATEVADLMAVTVEALQQSLRATDEQRDAATQVSQTMVEIRGAVDELASEQQQRALTAERVEELTQALRRLLETHGMLLDGVNGRHPGANGRPPQ